MNFNHLKNWLVKQICIKNRNKTVCIWYFLFLMVSTRKHSLQQAAKFSGINKSQFSRFLKNHSEAAVYNLHQLSKKQARQFSSSIKYLSNNTLAWKIAVIIDSTIQRRSTLHAQNANKFNHGKGFVIGHRWTNIILLINEMIIPLAPIAFYSKKYCSENALAYKTENQSVIEYLTDLNLKDYIGEHNPEEVVVLADSGYDDKKIQTTIAKKKWKFIIALNKTRSVKSQKQYSNTPKSKRWSHVAKLFKDHRIYGWQTVRLFTQSAKRKRMDFRIRQIIGYLRYVGKVQLICSEFKKRPDGRIKYLACNDLRAKPRHILIGYRIRWTIEIFHKQVKMYLGFQDVATTSFSSVMAHVHWVYCAYILLHSQPPGVADHIKSLVDKQCKIEEIVDSREKARVIQLLTQINGAERYKNELQRAFETSGYQQAFT